eukprot:1699768-Pyramimonas_sp.AAC.2
MGCQMRTVGPSDRRMGTVGWGPSDRVSDADLRTVGWALSDGDRRMGTVGRGVGWGRGGANREEG